MKKILFIASHRKDRAPGQRFRFEQYFDYLQEHGFHCELSYILNKKDDQRFYSDSSFLVKAFIILKNFWKRMSDIRKASGYDIIFIFREAQMTGSTFIEKRFKRSGKKIVFDFDDAIWLQDVSDANKHFGWMKNPDKTAKIIQLSDMVFAGNPYLADFASNYNGNVKIVPTTIDTEEYKRIPKDPADQSICIGWSGSITTIKHFEHALPILEQIRQRYGDKVTFKVIGDANYRHPGLDISGIAWTKEDEIKELSTFDIGIMPLPDDKWANGKCGLKGLQYMALEIPTIMSPVGVNGEIIKDGENGFLADKDEEWIQKLSQLIEKAELRKQLGGAGRKTVVERYSVKAWESKYLEYFEALLA